MKIQNTIMKIQEDKQNNLVTEDYKQDQIEKKENMQLMKYIINTFHKTLIRKETQC